MTARVAFAFFTFIVFNEGVSRVCGAVVRGQASWRGRNDERDVKQVVNSSEEPGRRLPYGQSGLGSQQQTAIKAAGFRERFLSAVFKQ